MLLCAWKTWAINSTNIITVAKTTTTHQQKLQISVNFHRFLWKIKLFSVVPLTAVFFFIFFKYSFVQLSKTFVSPSASEDLTKLILFTSLTLAGRQTDWLVGLTNCWMPKNFLFVSGFVCLLLCFSFFFWYINCIFSIWCCFHFIFSCWFTFSF